MNTLQIDYKYKRGQIVYFMYRNEIRKGIISFISIEAESKRLATYLIKRIIYKIISNFDKNIPFEKIHIKYYLHLVSKSGYLEPPQHLRSPIYEKNLYETQEDLIEALCLK